jgi:hypothetical protein
MSYLIFAVLAWLAVVMAVVFRCRRELGRAWCEPTLRRPVLIVESDDWGPGPGSDAHWLARLAEMLRRHQDERGRHPVMTIGVVLALPDPAQARTGGFSRLTLEDERFRAIRERLVEGANSGVFALQLHGMEHFWPPALQAAARRDPQVAQWLRWSGGKQPPRTEALPPHLQSRWVDASGLPTLPLAGEAIADAAGAEVAAFSTVFGQRPVVAVPPTFVWDERVERAWAGHGVRYVVTPGRRYAGRDHAGRLVAEGAPIHTGERSGTGVTYLVRDRYFEPALGHDADHALAALAEKTAAGQPTLLEMHRFNFTGDPVAAARALDELDRFLARALRAYPGLRFLSTAELGDRTVARDRELVEPRVVPRIAAAVARLARIPRLRKLAWLTGLALPAWALVRLAGSSARGAGAAARGARLAT